MASRRQSVGEQDSHAIVQEPKKKHAGLKLSQEPGKTTIPGACAASFLPSRRRRGGVERKKPQQRQAKNATKNAGAKACYRLVGARGQMLLDLLVPAAHAAPEVGERVLCRHPFDSSKRAYVTPSRVLELHAPVFEGGRRVGASENLRELRAYCQRQLGEVREDVLRPLNPTPYKTSVSAELFSFLQDALQRHQPITELT